MIRADLEELVTNFARVVHDDSGNYDISTANVQQVMLLTSLWVERKFKDGSQLEEGCHDYKQELLATDQPKHECMKDMKHDLGDLEWETLRIQKKLLPSTGTPRILVKMAIRTLGAWLFSRRGEIDGDHLFGLTWILNKR